MAVAPNRPLHCPLLGSSLNEPPKTQTGHSSAQNPLGAPPFLRAKASVHSVTCPARLGRLPAASLTCFLPFASLSSQLQSYFHTSRASALALFSTQNVLSFLHGSFPHFLQVFNQSYPWSPNISESSTPTFHIPLFCLTFSLTVTMIQLLILSMTGLPQQESHKGTDFCAFWPYGSLSVWSSAWHTVSVQYICGMGEEFCGSLSGWSEVLLLPLLHLVIRLKQKTSQHLRG